MEPPRDLGRSELWQESLQRSLARRGKLPRSSPELYRLRPERDLASVDIFKESAAYSRARREAAARRPGVPVPVVGLGSVSAVALLSATLLPSVLGGRSRRGGQAVTLAASGQTYQSVKSDASSQPRPVGPLHPRPYHPQPRTITTTPVTAPATRQTVAQLAHAARAKSATPIRRPATKPAAHKPTHPAVHSTVKAAAIDQTKPAHHRRPKPAHHQATKPHHLPTAPERPKAAHKPSPVHHAASPTKPKTVRHATTPTRRKAVHHPSGPKPAPSHHASKPPATHHHPTAHNPHAPKRHTHHSHAPKRHTHHSHAPKRHTRGYVNPLAHASVTPERIDQGVDYAGTGTLTAIGRARVNYVRTRNTGWPGAFIEYRLLGGRDAGRYVYYAEGVRPAGGIHVGRIVRAGQAVAHLIPRWPTGIEVGWGAGIGTEALAAKRGDQAFPTPEGKNFSARIASVGGPRGRG